MNSVCVCKDKAKAKCKIWCLLERCMRESCSQPEALYNLWSGSCDWHELMTPRRSMRPFIVREMEKK